LANLQKFEWRGAPFAAWLIKIAANAIADQGKRAAREASRADNPPEPAVKPDVDAIEHQARLFHLVNQLPADQRRVIFARFAEQRGIREIAVQLGRSEGAVKQLQLRALQNLRTQIEGSHA
jgi:RNA polymerase sigma-70 factor (ECF subfamily)